MKSFSPAGAATKAYYGLGARTFGNPDGALSGGGAYARGGDNPNGPNQGGGAGGSTTLSLTLTQNYPAALNIESVMTPADLVQWQAGSFDTLNITTAGGPFIIAGDNSPIAFAQTIVTNKIRNTNGNYTLNAVLPEPRDCFQVIISYNGPLGDGIADFLAITVIGEDRNGNTVVDSVGDPSVIAAGTYTGVSWFSRVTQVQAFFSTPGTFQNVVVNIGDQVANNDALTIPLYTDVTINIDSSRLQLLGTGGDGAPSQNISGSAGNNGGSALVLISGDGAIHNADVQITNQAGASVGSWIGGGGGGGGSSRDGNGSGGGAGGAVAGIGGMGSNVNGAAGQTYLLHAAAATGGAGANPGGTVAGANGGALATNGSNGGANQNNAGGVAGFVINSFSKANDIALINYTHTFVSGNNPANVIGGFN